MNRAKENIVRARKRLAFVMGVHAGMEEEYEKRHSPIWAELHRALKDHGAHNYSIYLLPNTTRVGAKLDPAPGPRQLFAYVEVEDEERWNAIAKTEICQKWWAYMSPLMPGNADGSPAATTLKEVFHID